MACAATFLLTASGEYKLAWHLRDRSGLVVFLGRRRPLGVAGVAAPGLCMKASVAGGGGTEFMVVICRAV